MSKARRELKNTRSASPRLEYSRLTFRASIDSMLTELLPLRSELPGFFSKNTRLFFQKYQAPGMAPLKRDEVHSGYWMSWATLELCP